MEDLRNFIEVDEHSALGVDCLKEGKGSFEVRGPRFEEGEAPRCQSGNVPRN